jgi:REP element-mobilizing transposase RayT
MKHRKSTRLGQHDYAAPAWYYVTFVTRDRLLLFGDVVDEQMQLSDFGSIVRDEWLRTAKLRTYVTLDEFVVMPDHFHAILALAFRRTNAVLVPHLAQRPYERLTATPWDCNDCRGGASPALPPHAHQRPTHVDNGRTNGTLSDVIGAFKSAVSKQINLLRGARGTTVWQRGFNDHIIRDTLELDLIRQYIRDNPRRWAQRRKAR